MVLTIKYIGNDRRRKKSEREGKDYVLQKTFMLVQAQQHVVTL